MTPSLHRSTPVAETSISLVSTFSPIQSADTVRSVAAGMVPIDDWDALFAAVRARLEMLASSPPSSDAERDDTQRRVRTGVLECVDALERLHAMLAFERRARAAQLPAATP